jgi:hypothetical protein
VVVVCRGWRDTASRMSSWAVASRGGSLEGGVKWWPVAVAVSSWAGDGVEGGGRRGTEDADSGPATWLLAAVLPRLRPTQNLVPSFPIL